MAKIGSCWEVKFILYLTHFCTPKKEGQGLQIVQEFRELNQNLHFEKYSMK